MQDVHLVFLNLRWSRCVALIFSLLTTSSCLLFLLEKRCERFNHVLIDLSLFHTDPCVSQLSLLQEPGVSALIIWRPIKKTNLLLPAKEKPDPASGNTRWEREISASRPFARIAYNYGLQKRLNSNLFPNPAPRSHCVTGFGLKNKYINK